MVYKLLVPNCPFLTLGAKLSAVLNCPFTPLVPNCPPELLVPNCPVPNCPFLTLGAKLSGAKLSVFTLGAKLS